MSAWKAAIFAACLQISSGARLKRRVEAVKSAAPSFAEAAQSSEEDVEVESGCANYRRIEDGTCANTCLGRFLGVCPRSLVVSAGSLEPGVCSSEGYTVRGDDLNQQAGPCGRLTFQTFTS